MDKDQLEAAVRTRRFGRNLLYLERTGSTNSVARVLADDGVPEGTVVVAGEQTAGRGRLGRRWVAPAGLCLLCSILFRPDLPVNRVHFLTAMCALAAADAVQALSGLSVDLKWPNDLVVSDASHTGWRKLAGLLTETSLSEDRVEYAVVGIGINVNVPAPILTSLAPNAASVLAEGGRSLDIPALLGSLLHGVERRYESLRDGESPHQEWAARLATLGQTVEASTADGPIMGIAEAVDEGGALLVRTPAGALHRLVAGDVTLRPSDVASCSL